LWPFEAPHLALSESDQKDVHNHLKYKDMSWKTYSIFGEHYTDRNGKFFMTFEQLKDDMEALKRDPKYQEWLKEQKEHNETF